MTSWKFVDFRWLKGTIKKMDSKKKIRLILTIIVMVVGGYYIQRYSIKINPASFTERAAADVPYSQALYEGGYK